MFAYLIIETVVVADPERDGGEDGLCVTHLVEVVAFPIPGRSRSIHKSVLIDFFTNDPSDIFRC